MYLHFCQCRDFRHEPLIFVDIKFCKTCSSILVCNILHNSLLTFVIGLQDSFTSELCQEATLVAYVVATPFAIFRGA